MKYLIVLVAAFMVFGCENKKKGSDTSGTADVSIPTPGVQPTDASGVAGTAWIMSIKGGCDAYMIFSRGGTYRFSIGCEDTKGKMVQEAFVGSYTEGPTKISFSAPSDASCADSAPNGSFELSYTNKGNMLVIGKESDGAGFRKMPYDEELEAAPARLPSKADAPGFGCFMNAYAAQNFKPRS